MTQNIITKKLSCLQSNESPNWNSQTNSDYHYV